MPERVVIDTSVFVSAMLNAGGGSREVIRLCLNKYCLPLMGYKLFSEYEDVLGRDELFKKCKLTRDEREELLNAFLSVCNWTDVYYLWRPNLIDEGDNHLIELGVAGGATSLVTNNPTDFRRNELRFLQLHIETVGEFLNRWRTEHGNDDH